MVEIKIRLSIGELIDVIRDYYKVPNKAECKLEVIAYDTTEYPTNMSNEMQFRISDGNLISQFSDNYQFEYDFYFNHNVETCLPDIIKGMVKELTEDHKIKNVYHDF